MALHLELEEPPGRWLMAEESLPERPRHDAIELLMLVPAGENLWPTAADTQAQHADTQAQHAEAAEAEVARLRRLLDERSGD